MTIACDTLVFAAGVFAAGASSAGLPAVAINPTRFAALGGNDTAGMQLLTHALMIAFAVELCICKDGPDGRTRTRRSH